MFSKDFTELAKQSPILSMLTGIGVCAALVALLWGAKAVQLREWPMPSEVDWLRVELFGNIDALRGYHLLSMLDNYDEHMRIHDAKAAHLVIAQRGLTIAALSLGIVVLWNAVASVFS